MSLKRHHLLASVPLGILAVVLLLSGWAHGLIDPKFTPVDLYKAATTVVLLELSPGGDGAPPAARVLSAIKGERPAGVVLDLAGMSETAQQDLAEALGPKGGTALLLLGNVAYSDGLRNVRGSGALLAGGTWFGVESVAGGKWQLAPDGRNLRNVWAGSALMLARCFEYLAADPGASVPVQSGLKWTQAALIGTVPGKVSGCHAVDFLGGAGMCLLVTSDQGDHLYRVANAGAPQDITAASKLTSRSVAVVLGDFTGGGQLDLLSWDGRQLVLYTQGADHTLGAAQPISWNGACHGLAAVGLEGGQRSGVVVNTGTVPVVLAIHAGAEAAATPVSASPPDETLGTAGEYAVADFNGDGAVDVLQTFAEGVALYPGTKSGGFAAPVVSRLRMPAALTSLAVGDFDADGLLDAVGTSGRGIVALRNAGEGRFVNHLTEAGEMSYDEFSASTAAAACDLNGDGRQELFLLFARGRAPAFFFNRGFYTTGVDRTLAAGFGGDTPLPGVEALIPGQQAGVAADFDGDGREEVAVVAQGGELFLLGSAHESHAPLGVTLAGASGLRGPLTVAAQDGKRNLGARLLRPGLPVFFGKAEAGPLVLRWRQSDGRPEEKRAIVLKPQRVELPPGQP